MKSLWRRFSILAGIGMVLAFVLGKPVNAGPSSEAKSERPRLAVLIIFDQMRGDYLIRWQELFGQGGFKRLQAEGTWFQNCHYPYAHTVTATGHASLGTGAWPSGHGIVANEWYDRASGKTVASVESDRYRPVPPPSRPQKGRQPFGAAPTRLLLPTLGDALKEATGGKSRVIGLSLKDRAAILPVGKKADAAYWYSTSAGAFVTSTYYREKLHPWVADYNRRKPADVWFDRDWTRLYPRLDYDKYNGPDDVKAEWTGYMQGRTFPHSMTGGLFRPGKLYYQAIGNSPYGNDLLLGLVKMAIESEKLGQHESPDFLAVSFSSNDLVGHSYGPDSHEVLDITLRSDLIVRELLDHLDAKVGKGKYVLAVSADHGICPLPEVARAKGKDAGRLEPMALVAKAESFLDKKFGDARNPASWVEAAVYPWIYLNRKVLKERRLDQSKVEKALADWLSTQRGIQTAFTRTQLLSEDFTNNPLGMMVRRSFHPERSGDVQIVMKPYYLLTDRETGTLHGTPHEYDTHVPLLLYGAGIAAKVRKDAVTPQAAVVILANALGIKPPAGAEAALPEGVVTKPK
jgi:hypothetical protein